MKVGDHRTGPFGSAAGLRMLARLHVTRVRHVVVAGYDDVARRYDHV